LNIPPIARDRDLPVAVGPVNGHSSARQARRHVGRRMAELVSSPATDHGNLRLPGIEQLLTGGCSASVVRHLEDPDTRGCEVRQDRALDLGADVAGQQERHVPVPDFQDE
jgi:hypothetical protein